MMFGAAAESLGHAMSTMAFARAERQAAQAYQRMVLREAYRDCPHRHWIIVGKDGSPMMVVERPPSIPRVPRKGWMR